MNSTVIELYLYMNSSDEIIKWLESEGVKTKEQATNRLEPYVKNNVRSVVLTPGSSLAGTSGCVKKVFDYFESKEKENS